MSAVPQPGVAEAPLPDHPEGTELRSNGVARGQRKMFVVPVSDILLISCTTEQHLSAQPLQWHGV